MVVPVRVTLQRVFAIEDVLSFEQEQLDVANAM